MSCQSHVVEPHRSDGARFVIGLCIMALGVLMLLDNLGLIDATRTLRFWPLAFVLIGAMRLMRRNDTRSQFWGVILICFGAWLIFNTLGVVQVGPWEFFWPVAMVLIGFAVLRRASWPTFRHAADDRRTHLAAVMGESKQAVQDAPLRGASMTAVLGSCALDLRRATIAPGQEATVE